MKTSLTIIPNVSSGAPSSLLEIVQAYPLLHKGLGHLAALYLLYLHFLITIYLITKLSITYYFSACRENLTKNCLSFPSAPCWVRHSYLSKGLRWIPYTCGSSCNNEDNPQITDQVRIIATIIFQLSFL